MLCYSDFSTQISNPANTNKQTTAKQKSSCPYQANNFMLGRKNGPVIKSVRFLDHKDEGDPLGLA